MLKIDKSFVDEITTASGEAPADAGLKGAARASNGRFKPSCRFSARREVSGNREPRYRDLQHGTAANRLVLRDGSVATVRPATPADRDAVRRFYHDLSPESRRRRFMTAGRRRRRSSIGCAIPPIRRRR